MDKKLLNEMTTKADRLFTAIEDENSYNEFQDFQDEVKSFLNNAINFFESIGGKVEGMDYVEKESDKLSSFSAYVDNLIPSDRDEDCWCDVFGNITVTVPEEWLKEKVIDNERFRSLEDFYANFTWDDTDGLLQLAIDEHILVGVSMGKTE